MEGSIVAARLKQACRKIRRRTALGLTLLASVMASPAMSQDTTPYLRALAGSRRQNESDRNVDFLRYPGNVTYSNASASSASDLDVWMVKQQGSSAGRDRYINLTGLEDAPPAKDDDKPGKDGADIPEGKEIGQAPVNNNLQFLRTQDVLLAKGKWQADMGLAYTLFDNDFPVPVVDHNGNIVSVTEGHIRTRLLYSPFGVRYGLTENVQVFGVLPVGYSSNQISTVGQSDTNNSGGLGDFVGGASFHLLDACGDFPDVIATFGFTAPTGNFTTPLFGVVPGSNLGQGFWALQGNLLFINRLDPVVLFYGFGYRHLFERTFDNIRFQVGEQISYQFGAGFSVNDRLTLSTTLQGFYITNTSANGQFIPGTNVEPISLRFAATMAKSNRIVEPFAIVGMTDFAPRASLGVVWTFY